MSELQAEADDGITYDSEDLQAGPLDNDIDKGAELATAEPEEAEKNTTDSDEPEPTAQDLAQKAINKQHRKYREEERKRLEIEQRLKETEERLSKFESSELDVSIPPIPDAWDDDYDAKIRERDSAIQRKAEADAKKQFAADQDFRTQQEQQLKAQRETNDKLASYSKRAAEHGIKEADLGVAVNRVVDAGISPDVADFLLTDPDGPVITAYLADERNTLELFDLAQMSPVNVGMRLAEIRVKAAEMKKPRSSAPPPPDMISGRGKVEESSPFLAGAKFE